MKYTLLMPTKNEIEGLRAIAPRIKKEWVHQIVVVDGNSTDGTQAYVKQMGYTLVEQKNLGSFGYYGEALPYCTGDIIITFSPDGNSIPELIPSLIEKMNAGHDMVIVSRYRENASSEDDNRITALGNFALTGMINFLYGGSFTDSLVMFRAWRKSLCLSIASLPEFEARTCVIAARDKWNVAEIPGNEPARIGGVSKMRPLANGWQILKVIISEFKFGNKKKEASNAIR